MPSASGSIAMVFTLTLDYRTFTDKSHLIYIGLLAILLYVLFLGTVQMGARRWIPIGGFNLQPSEFAKVGVALVLAKYFGENRGVPTWTDLAVAGGLTCLPLALIAREPDLGTAVTLLARVSRYRVSRRHADAHSRLHGAQPRADRARGVEVRAQGLPEESHFNISRSLAGREEAPDTSRSRRGSRWDQAD